MRALLLLGLCLTACRTTWREGATVLSASGKRLCAKHRVALVTIRVYEAPPGWLIHEGLRPYEGVVAEHCPNSIPPSFALRPIGLLHVPTTFAYCPICEKELLDGLRVPDERAAIKWAKYGAGEATKGPYQVSLQNDVWTVNCFLKESGRPATIKISKEKGALLGASFPSYSHKLLPEPKTSWTR
jgi:hypothetical protein